MSEISNLYSSRETIYRTGARRRSSKGMHGDVKHIVFKDGRPVYTEVIHVNQESNEQSGGRGGEKNQNNRRPRRRIQRKARSSEVVLKEKKRKLSDRLKKAMAASETLWNDKNGLWISYQGNRQFLVKQYSKSNQLLDNTIMSTQDIIDSEMPGIFDTGWEKI